MFAGISPERVSAMTSQERRWLDNVKKAFADSDADFDTARMPDNCIENLFKGIDTAKRLRLSLIGGTTDLSASNRARFIEFLELEIPARQKGAKTFMLTHSRTGKERECSIAEILYEARCMVHENEN